MLSTNLQVLKYPFEVHLIVAKMVFSYMLPGTLARTVLLKRKEINNVNGALDLALRSPRNVYGNDYHILCTYQRLQAILALLLLK